MPDKGSSPAKYRVKVPRLEDYEALVACRAACPLRTDAKGYTKAVAEGNYEQAYWIARQTNPLVSVCSRVCRAPCEDACTVREVDGPVEIRALKRFACDQHGVGSGTAVKKVFEPLAKRGDVARDIVGNDVLGLLRMSEARERVRLESRGRRERVAIVGCGPAGLAAAHDLALLGYGVTIHEAAPVPGGMLNWGIPEFRLPRKLLQSEIEAILDLGVELRLNSPIGEGRSIADLEREGYEAIFIAVGLQASRWLPLEGSDLSGVWGGITYLRSYRDMPVEKRSLLVVGGGGVAIDCAQLALRQGARTVMLASLESWEEMPAGESEKADAREEGIRFYPSLGPKRFLGKEGHVTGVEFLAVESVFDSQGSFNPTLRPNTETILEADTVLVAVGQASEHSVLGGAQDLETTPAGAIRVDENLATSAAGVFAGGDVLAGPQSVVHAISDGKRAARSIDEYLSGRKLRVKKRGFMRLLGPDFYNGHSDKIKAVRPPKRSAEQRIASHEEIDLPYEEEQARLQAARCQQCHIQTVFDPSLCILCGTCVDTCVASAYRMVTLEDIEGDRALEKLTEKLLANTPPGRAMTAIIKDETRCVRCGACARRCPTGAITMQAFHVEEEWEYE